ncbi:signal peptidase I [Enterococcus cecorum]|uniref:signal peptidase I n=1 Tax=Enterococcus cecorum TaxID=44008 RepID=UPI00326731E8
MKKVLHILLNILGTVLIFMVLIGILVNVNSAPKGKGFFGYKGYTALSNSMKPTFSAGDYVVDKMVAYDEIKKGDVVSYYPDDYTIVTHRVKEVTPQGFIMQGDANNAQDAFTVTKDHYIGKMVLVIPLLGRLPELLMNPILWCIGSIFILGIIIYEIIYQRKVKKEKTRDRLFL